MTIFNQIISKPLNTLNVFWFNLYKKIRPGLTNDEIEVLKKTPFFENITELDFNEIQKNLCLIKYPKNKLIFREGEQANSFYIIVEGSVRVFTHNSHGMKIALARLNQGDYFGEQALLGNANKTRNANIETITETILIKVPQKILSEQLKVNQPLQSFLKKSGAEQAINNLIASTKFYNDLSTLTAHIEHPIIKEFPKGKIIFSERDKADNAYLILQGEIELLLPTAGVKKLKSISLQKGAIFGELGVIRNKPRVATAIAQKDSMLLVISPEELKKYLSQYPQLQQLFASLQSIYVLPSHSMVEQYLGNLPGMGAAVTSIYKMDDGRCIISAKAVNEDYFNMSTIGVMTEKTYTYVAGLQQIELAVSNNQLIGVKVLGVWDDLPIACQLILENKKMPASLWQNFEDSADLTAAEKPETGAAEIICQCMSVTRGTLKNLIDSGIKDFDELSSATGACTVCKCCKFKILDMLGETVWARAVMQITDKHNENIYSYSLKSASNHFKSMQPGQHVIIQAKINDHWLERPYTISARPHEQEIRITIKKEPNGYFTTWLFEAAPNEIMVNVTKPQGEFTIDFDANKTAICFAGGIGITPFISYAKALTDANTKKRLHIIYCAANKNHFILTDEFAEIIQRNPLISILYWSQDDFGLLSEAEIIKTILNFNEPDIYICGSERFEQFIHQVIEKINYNKNKIHTEKFVHAGSA